jgi:hypothetical protein
MTTAERIRLAWIKIPEARNSRWPNSPDTIPKNLEDNYGNTISDYLLFLLDINTLEKLSGQPIYIKNSEVDKDGKPKPYQFDHYNKKFVEWAVLNAVPASTDAAFKAKTNVIYKDYISLTAELFLRAIYGLESNPKKHAAMQKAYLDAMNSKGGLRGPEAFFATQMAGLPEGIGAPATIGFWLRRGLDGSAPALKSGLEKLINTYAPDRLAALKAEAKKK